jgi:hypothetical protein
MTDHEHKLDEIITLRPAPAEPGNSSSGSGTYEIICRICGDDPGWDHQEVSPELQQIRGPYTLNAAVAAFVEHDELHNGTDNRHPVAPDRSGPGTKSSR